MFVGLLLGLAIALGVAFYLNKTPIPFIGKPKPAGDGKDAGQAAEADRRHAAGRRQAAGTSGEAEVRLLQDPARRRGAGDARRSCKRARRKAATRVNRKPRRTFISSRRARSRTRPMPTTRRRSSRSSASNRASSPRNLPDKGTWYRVRLGPYTTLEESEPGAARAVAERNRREPGQSEGPGRQGQ